MRLPVLLAAAGALLIATPAFAQPPSAEPPPKAVTRTLYTRNTELFAEWRLLVVGQAALQFGSAHPSFSPG